MTYYIIAVTQSHQFPIATDFCTVAEARNAAKILLDLPGSLIGHITVKDTQHENDFTETIRRTSSPKAEAEGGLK